MPLRVSSCIYVGDSFTDDPRVLEICAINACKHSFTQVRDPAKVFWRLFVLCGIGDCLCCVVLETVYVVWHWRLFMLCGIGDCLCCVAGSFDQTVLQHHLIHACCSFV